jgi:hypothetical protein
MSQEIALRGKYKQISWKTYFAGSSYNSGAILAFTYKKERHAYKVDTYVAQSKSSIDELMPRLIADL